MKLIKIQVGGLPHFKENLEIDFFAQQRVQSENNDGLYQIFSNIYVNNSISFIGINASGKTTILRVIAFVINLLNNKPINTIETKEILEDINDEQTVTFTTFFYHSGLLNKLETVIKKTINPIDENTRYMIESENLWSQKSTKIKTKKGMFDFQGIPAVKRNQDEEYLMDDVSIIIAFNKKHKSKVFLCDMSKWTNFNMLNLLGKFPKELLLFLDPSIEYLKCAVDEKDVDIRLKFKGKEEILMNNPMVLDKYLSSGTIKGISVFMNAFFAFEDGGYLIVDEVENHFNREIVSTLIRFFLDSKVNKNGAVIIFSTHYSELLDEFERNDNIFIVRNRNGISAENLSNILKRNDIKKSEAYQSDFLEGTVPTYEAYIALKKVLINRN